MQSVAIPRGLGLVVPLALGLVLASVDLMLALWHEGWNGEPVAALFSADLGVILALYSGLWLMTAPLHRFRAKPRAATALGIGTFLALLWVAGAIEVQGTENLHAERLVLPAVASIAAGAAAFVLARDALQRADSARVARGVIVGVALTAVGLFGLSWLMRSSRHEPAPHLVWLVVWLVVLIGSAHLLARRFRFGFASPLLAALCLFGLSSPLFALLGDERSPDAARTSAARRRVLLIVVDTLRWDSLGCHAGSSGLTPNVSALAQDSVVFEAAHSPAPWTLPAMCSLLTGVSPAVHLAVKPEMALPARIPTVAERLSRAGLHTAAFGENGFLKPNSHLSRGFDEYLWFPREAAPVLGVKILRHLVGHRFRDEADAGHLTEIAGDWLAEHAAEEFFLWLHYFDPHVPYAPPPDFQPDGAVPQRIGRAFLDPEDVRLGFLTPTLAERQWIRGLYDGEVRYFDQELGRLVARMKALGIYDETTIVLTADHGEEFWEHDGFEHGHSVYEELLRVPFLVKLPGSALAGRVAEPVSTESVTPTILRLCDVPVDPAEFSSPSLVARDPELRLDVDSRPLFGGGQLYYAQREAVLAGGYKYIVRPGNHDEELYRLTTDAAERESLVDTEPAELATMRALLAQHLDDARALRAHYGVEGPDVTVLDEATERDLRELGYVK